MGDHADEAIEQGFAEMAAEGDYLGGLISEDEAYEHGIIDEHGAIMGSIAVIRKIKATKCKFCGKTELHWKSSDIGKWRLHDKNNKIHSCKQYKK
ncbi:MAG: hypothetical protein DRP09_16555 [Candidatus Thorarchaeota archaeon]|nr:MAG: hypothetical protein DRP09_16555 [Candidatus Thorarchaeota archaeon]